MIVKEGLLGETSWRGRGKGEGDGVNMIEVHYNVYENSIMKPTKNFKNWGGAES
jgi:hypothetical protein